jgi:hypothetical protein
MTVAPIAGKADTTSPESRAEAMREAQWRRCSYRIDL